MVSSALAGVTPSTRGALTQARIHTHASMIASRPAQAAASGPALRLGQCSGGTRPKGWVASSSRMAVTTRGGAISTAVMRVATCRWKPASLRWCCGLIPEIVRDASGSRATLSAVAPAGRNSAAVHSPVEVKPSDPSATRRYIGSNRPTSRLSSQYVGEAPVT